MQIVEIKTEEELRSLMARLREMEHFAYDTETTGFDWWRTEIFALSLSEGTHSWVIYTSDFGKDLISYFLQCIFEDQTKTVVGHNIKFDRHHTKASFGVDIRRICHDTLIKAHLLDENRKNGLKALMISVLGIKDDYEGAVHVWLKTHCGAQENWNFSLVPRDLMSPYAALDAYSTYLLDRLLDDQIKQHFSQTYEIDRKVLDILYRMEQQGVKVDLSYLANQQERYEKMIKDIRTNIFLTTGYEFNIDSTVELAEVLYIKLGLPCTRLTRNGAQSTDAEAIQSLEHPSIPYLLNYADASHMLSNFIIPLQEKADKAGRIHADYSLTTTKTGRFACRNPNMQNMPKDLTLRKAFVCDEGKGMFFWDHSQIEMVGFAMYSKDPKMMEALRNGTDLHTLAASEALDIPISSVDKYSRALGKGTNFAIIFGVGKAKLSRYINSYINDKTKHLSADAAMAFKQKYFYKFPAVAGFQRQVIDTVRTTREPFGNFVRNKFGRVRRLSIDKAYQGVNHLIQGWAGYLMKSSMIRIDEKFPGTDWRQNVHDQIRIDNNLNSNMLKEWVNEVGDCLTDWPDIPVPVSCTIETSKTNWAEVEEIKYVPKRLVA